MLNTVRNLKLWQKLGLVVAVMAVPIVVMVFLFVQATNVLVTATSDESSGLEYLVPVVNFHNHVAQHRDLMAAVLVGDASQRNRAQGLEPTIEADLAAIDAVDQRFGKQFSATEKLAEIKRDWRDLRQKGNTLQAKESLAMHTKLSTDTRELIRTVGDKSSLILDPDLDAYYIMSMLVIDLPQIQENLSLMRGLGTGSGALRGFGRVPLFNGTLPSARLSPEEQAQATAVSTELERQFAQVRRSLGVAAGANASLERVLGPPLLNAISTAETFFQRFNAGGGNGAVDIFESGVNAAGHRGTLVSRRPRTGSRHVPR